MINFMFFINKERGNILFRIVDRYLGIPLLFFISLLKFKKRREIKISEVKNICIIKIGAIGDSILSLPTLKFIKERKDDVKITVIASSSNYEVFKRYDFISSVKVIELSKVLRKPFYLLNFVKEVNLEQYDLLIDFEAWARFPALIASLIKAKFKIGFKTFKQFRHFPFDFTVLHRSDVHEMENYFSLFSSYFSYDIKSVYDTKVYFPIEVNETVKVDSLLRDFRIDPSKLVIFHPWASGYNKHFKEMSFNTMKKIVDIVVNENLYIGITGSLSDKKNARLFLKETDQKDKIFSFCGFLTLGETAYIIKISKCVISVNTGIMHLSSLLRKPTIALHGPTNPNRWGPVWGKNYIIRSKKNCSPCLNLGFEYACNYADCMEYIPIDEIKQILTQISENN